LWRNDSNYYGNAAPENDSPAENYNNIALLLTIVHGEHVEFTILTRSEKKKEYLIH